MLAFAAYASASAVQVLDVAKPWSPVGAWGPALVNLGSPLGGWGSPLGAPLIGLGQGVHGLPWAGAHGLPWAGAYGSPWAGAPWGAAPGLPLAAAHGLPLAGHGHEGSYVAANRGSVHVAPLTGHIQSVRSTNLEPAPGTTW